MSKNYDMIATVDIDIASPLVDDTSFDNLLIMGIWRRMSVSMPAWKRLKTPALYLPGMAQIR